MKENATYPDSSAVCDGSIRSFELMRVKAYVAQRLVLPGSGMMPEDALIASMQGKDRRGHYGDILYSL